MNISGKCHCGNIAFDLEWEGDPPEIPARACGCTFCQKHGGVWTSNPKSRLAVRVGDASQVSKYEFGTRTATFHVCARCGAVPLVTSEIDDRLYAVINVNVPGGNRSVVAAPVARGLRRGDARVPARAPQAQLDRRRAHRVAGYGSGSRRKGSGLTGDPFHHDLSGPSTKIAKCRCGASRAAFPLLPTYPSRSPRETAWPSCRPSA
jgi:hypothetical protein